MGVCAVATPRAGDTRGDALVLLPGDLIPVPWSKFDDMAAQYSQLSSEISRIFNRLKNLDYL